MKKMLAHNEKIVITATTANSWIYPEIKNWAQSTDELVEDAVKCYEAGAAIAHVHLPRGEEVETVKRIREQCDVLIQAGMSSESIPQREGDFNARPDMLSIILNHHAENFPGAIVDVLHPLKELEDYCRKCQEFNIKPEWEVWHTGSYWNLNYLTDKGLLNWALPHVLTLFFNWPGGTWSPPTFDSYLHRTRYIPPNSVHTVSAMGDEHTRMIVMAISHGGNIRVGTEDYPFLEKGVPAKDNAEIVSRIVDICKYMGREVADPSEARKILGL
ncbi:MAG: 3-keto-5-aminohexanoate cleavage protein [Candidatus Lokiarchaeota archaeon]|nr:3-keto-5-aminohexanoate cleavage protein [Candidatus Lokiarchaeota archaeon]MBD3337660.1 3-keto-5-aminohexanoate cleavage protein [Candidatus Lokiarchaeota archaeon]